MLSIRKKPRRAVMYLAGFFVALVGYGFGTFPAWAQDAKSGTRNGAAEANPERVREFAPGIEIDWNKPAVRLESRVVLREGPLELFACSPQTKEHESILVVLARPLRIFQALGLIGLESGSPPRFDEASGRWKLASGEPLMLRVEWRDGDRVRSVLPEEWMIENESSRPPKELNWVFSGSTIRRDAASELSREAGRDTGRFAADSDGTVACVVDFDSALISLSSLHSADDAELWLSANPEAIPPIGTRCILTIESAFHPKLEIDLNNKGGFSLGKEELSDSEIGERLARNADSRSPRLVVHVTGDQELEAVRSAIESIRSELKKRGLDPDSTLKVRQRASKQSGAPETGPP